MKKNTRPNELLECRKILTVCFAFLFAWSAIVKGANIDIATQNVSAQFINISLNDVIWELQKQTDFTFIYSTNDVKNIIVKNVSANNEIVTTVLDKCLEDSGLTYSIHNGVIAIKKAEAPAIAIAAPQQKVTVFGQVVDNLGDPMPGVNVLVKETMQGSITDLDGKFSIDITQNKNVTLQLSFIGFTTQEVVASPGKTIRVVMEDDTNVLEEVVVTGYGTFKKSAFAGSASTVKMAEKEDVPAVDFKSLLQGSTPGVQVNSASGTLGASSKVTIRGMGSINASTEPLYVVDGVPVMSSVNSSIDSGTDVMATLNVSDIENITVIKDAAAASLYGSRAANGVIVITTKSGKEGKPSFNLKADWGFSKYATDYREVLGGPERRELFTEGLQNQARYILKKDILDENGKPVKDENGKTMQRPYTEAEIVQYADDNIDLWAPIPEGGYVDWEKALFRENAPYQNYEFSASGGDKKISYYSSLSYNKQDGIVRQQGLERITGRLNVKYQITEKLQLGANILYSKMNQFGSSEGGTYTAPIYATRHKLSASDAIYDEEGNYNVKLLELGKRNPKSQLDLNYKKQILDRAFNTLFANYKFIPGLIFNTTLSYDRTNSGYKSWTDPRSTDGESDNGSLSRSMNQYRQMVWKNNLTYDVSVKDKHNMDFLAGYETHEYRRSYLSGSIKDFPNVEKPHISNGANISGLSGYDDYGWRMVSYLGRVNYNYENKYYLGASARIDGSSRLHKDSRWGTFWSASAAWRISSEPFMESVRHILTDTRLRVSYGSNGTLPNEYYGYMDLVSFKYSYNSKPGIVDKQIGNKDMKWEKNYNLNVGLDFRLFDRVSTTIEFYNRNTSDLLLDMPLSYTTGFTSMLTNVGKMRNRGVELDITADIIRGNDFSWISSLNLSHNKNKVLNLGDQDEIISGYKIRRVGLPYYSYYVKEFAGIDPQDGWPMYYINDPEKPNERTTTKDAAEANYIVYKNADPKLAGGWSNSFKYKWFDLSFNWTFTFGGYSYDRGASKLEHAGKSEKGAIQSYYSRRWQKPGDVTDIEMFMVGNEYCMADVVNSRRVHSSDHFRLKNLTFGVTLPKSWTKKANLSNVRFYFSGINLLTFAAYDGYDPEIPLDGDLYFETPKMKTLTFGVDIKF